MTVHHEMRGDVAVLYLGDDENRFNRNSVDAINAELDEIVATDGPIALVTTGIGKFYSNGLDLDWMRGDGTADEGFLADVHELLLRVLHLDMITVAAINGHAFAAGAMFASGHDHTFMRADRGYWCLPEVDLGIALTPDMFTVLQSHIPHATLAEASLTGRRYTGTEAVAAGIADQVSNEQTLVNDAVAFVEAFVSKNRTVIANHKQQLYPRSRSNARLV